MIFNCTTLEEKHSTMPIIFQDPILGKLEDLLWRKSLADIGQRLKLRDPRKLVRSARELYMAMLSQERAKVKLAINMYSKIAYAKTKESVEIALSRSKPAWFTIEVANLIRTPVVLVVPQIVLRNAVELVLAETLASRIEFAGMLPESRLAFAEDAIPRYFSSITDDARRLHWNYRMNIRFGHKATLVDFIKNDWYYLGNDREASRVDTIVFCTKDSKWWKERNRRVDFRPQGRRFGHENLSRWGLAGLAMEDLRKR